MKREDRNTVTGQQDYVLVPRTPTPEMLADGWYGAHDEDAEAVWRLMIEAWETSSGGTVQSESLPVAESDNKDND